MSGSYLKTDVLVNKPRNSVVPKHILQSNINNYRFLQYGRYQSYILTTP